MQNLQKPKITKTSRGNGDTESLLRSKTENAEQIEHSDWFAVSETALHYSDSCDRHVKNTVFSV